MSDTAQAVRSHYVARDDEATIVPRVRAMLEASGIEPLTARSLAPFDQFHVRGLASTTELATLAKVDTTMTVLDAGCGFGGPARYLADVFGCRVTGVDLTPGFVDVSRFLTERTGQTGRVSFDVGDLHALPYADRSFDLVWTQHVVMNVSDRAAVYREFHRVLKPGGRVAFYDVVASDDKRGPLFPVPWSEGPDTNFLLTEAETRSAFAQTGFTIETWRDGSDDVLRWFASPPTPPTTPSTAPSLSLIGLLGPRLAEMTRNFAANLREGRIRVVMGLATSHAPPPAS